MSCNGNCKCNQAKTDCVDMPHGEQLKFAFDEDKVDNAELITKIKKEVLDILEGLYEEFSEVAVASDEKTVNTHYKGRVMGITVANMGIRRLFEKYLER